VGIRRAGGRVAERVTRGQAEDLLQRLQRERVTGRLIVL
jgi:hypothetical protein